MFVTADTELADVLQCVRNIALVGASDRPDRPSHAVLRFLRQHGYCVFAVNPALVGKRIDGMPVYGSLTALPEPVDMVDVFRRAEHLPGIVEACLSTRVPVLWTQLGVVHPTALTRAADRGLRVIADRCPAVEWPRLAALGLLR